MDNERIELDSRRHLVTLLRPLLVAVFAVVAALVAGMLLTPRVEQGIVDTTVGVVAGFFLLRFLWRVLEWRAARTVVTNRRLFRVSGVLTRKVSTMPLARMTDLTYRRPIFGRLLGYGEIVVESAGTEQGLQRLDHLPRPDDFYRTITGIVATVSPQPFDEDGHPVPNWDEEDTGPLPRVVV